MRRSLRSLAWLVPSIVAACGGALAAGVVEGWGSGAHATAVTTGLVALLAVPLLLAASIVARGIVHAWRPAELRARLVDADGSAPRLAGWVGVVWLGTLALAWSMFQGMWLLASWTAFKPRTLGYLAPMLGVATLLAIVALSRPAARVLAWLAARLDRLVTRPWRARGLTLLRPPIIVTGAIVTMVAAWLVIWEVLVTRRVPDATLGVIAAPCAGVLATIAAHAAWRRLGRARAIAAGVLGVAVVATVATALEATASRPALALAIWAREPLARQALERVFSLERIRGELPLDDFRLRERTREHPDLVLVTFDALRADRTPPYGGPAAMPALRELGQRGAVFAWAFAPSSLTRRSMPSILTGLAPNRVRGSLEGSSLRLDPRHVLLAERLRAGGYATAGFTCCAEYWGDDAATGWARGLEHVTVDDDGLALARAARQWIQAQDGSRPMFVWLHVGDLADWSRGHRASSVEDRTRAYDAALARADAVLVEVLGAFQRRPPIAIVTGDHGTSLGEHALPAGVAGLYNDQLHVPLVIAGPGIAAGRIVEATSLVDLAPTVLELAGFEPPPRGTVIDGRSLVDVASGRRNGESTAGTAYAAEYADARGEPALQAVVRGTWKLIVQDGSYELYDLRADPSERYNLFGQRLQLVAELKLLLSTKVRAGQQAPF